MDYLEFKTELRKNIQERCGEDREVFFSVESKNNRYRVETMNIQKAGAHMSQAFSLPQLFEQYEEEGDMDAVAEYVLKCHREHAQYDRIDLSFFMDFFKAKDHIVCRVVNARMNQELLADVPHQLYMDLAVMYQCNIEHELFGRGCILIDHSHLQLWGIDEEMLREAAIANTSQRPYELMSLTDMLHDMTGMNFTQEEQDDIHMYVLTNQEKYYGAANILFDDVLSGVAEKLDDDFYVLPSSIHECMILPMKDAFEADQLGQMVKEINEEFVTEEEILGDSVYYYDRAQHQLSLAGC